VGLLRHGRGSKVMEVVYCGRGFRGCFGLFGVGNASEQSWNDQFSSDAFASG